MVFSSLTFLFLFFPIVIGVYYLCPRALRNLWLLAASLLFYAWGEPVYIRLMVASILFNYLCGLGVAALQKREKKGIAKTLLILCVVGNIGALGVFKYADLLIGTINGIAGSHLALLELALPIGISFYTFQALSYVIDVYRGTVAAQKNPITFGTYIALFPQLIAGPIVQYKTVEEQLSCRRETAAQFAAGIGRFTVGLGKKVLIANQVGALWDTVSALPQAQLAAGTAWLGALAFTFQIYFDFSGYSDMAIGLGKMFGFHFLENFRYPFIAKSVAGFWRRWHISLTTWFQDYLYIPLGGSRVKTKARLIFNMFMVWSLTGLWHGAAWTYLLWGCGFFVMLVIERFSGMGKWMEKHAIGHFYAMLMVVFLTVMIRCDNLPHAWTMYGSLLGLSGAPAWNSVSTVMVREYGWFFLAALICGLPVRDFIVDRLHVNENLVRIAGAVLLVALTAVSVSYIAVNGYNPFIYFNF